MRWRSRPRAPDATQGAVSAPGGCARRRGGSLRPAALRRSDVAVGRGMHAFAGGARFGTPGLRSAHLHGERPLGIGLQAVAACRHPPLLPRGRRLGRADHPVDRPAGRGRLEHAPDQGGASAVMEEHRSGPCVIAGGLPAQRPLPPMVRPLRAQNWPRTPRSQMLPPMLLPATLEVVRSWLKLPRSTRLRVTAYSRPRPARIVSSCRVTPWKSERP